MSEKHQTEAEVEPEEAPRRGGLLDGFADAVKKAIVQGAEAFGDEKLRENVVTEALRKAMSKGNEVVEGTEDSVRRFISDLPLPKEVVDKLGGRLDDYKTDLLGMVKDEVHDFLGKIDLGHELQKMLTSLSFEITTEVRFIPNDKGVKPSIKTAARVKRSRKKRKESAAEAAEKAAADTANETASNTEDDSTS